MKIAVSSRHFFYLWIIQKEIKARELMSQNHLYRSRITCNKRSVHANETEEAQRKCQIENCNKDQLLRNLHNFEVSKFDASKERKRFTKSKK